MAVRFELIKHNFLGYFNPNDCSAERLRPWIRFLNGHPIVGSSICLNTPLKTLPLFRMCSSAVVSPDKRSFTFTIDETSYLVDETIFKTVFKSSGRQF